LTTSDLQASSPVLQKYNQSITSNISDQEKIVLKIHDLFKVKQVGNIKNILVEKFGLFQQNQASEAAEKEKRKQ